MSLTIKWDDGQFKKNINKIERAFADPSTSGPVGKGTLLAGQALLHDAQDIVPFDTGDLKNSGNADKVVRAPGGMQIEVGFNRDYAAEVHENMKLNISQRKASKSGLPRQQKYLEKPMKENGEKYGNILARSILKYLS